MAKIHRIERTYSAMRTSKNNLTVTLPQEWRILNGIKPGDKLILYIDDENLVVRYEK